MTLKNKQAEGHPPWSDMITECIATTPDGTRRGVSRPAIKKFVDSKYHLAMNAAATGQLNRAISHGTAVGHFVLPKGPSGKVKLAPKENSPTVTETRELPVSTKTKILASFAEEHPSKATRKYTSKAKKMRVTPFPGRQVPPRNATRVSSAIATRSKTRKKRASE